MSILLLLISTLSLTVYLYGIWLWYLWILPLIFLIGIFFYYSENKVLETGNNHFFQKNSLMLVWILILAWLLWTLITLGVDIWSTRRIIIIINFLLRIWSYFFDYEDWQKIFQWGLYFTLISFLWYTAFKSDSVESFMKIFSNISLLTTVMLWTIPIIISVKKKPESSLYYKLTLSWLISLILVIINTLPNHYISIIISLWILIGLLRFIYRNNSKEIARISDPEEVSIRRILAWERVSNQKKTKSKKWNEMLENLVRNIPDFFKIWIEMINIGLLIFFVSQYISWLASSEYINQIFYRSIFILIIANILLLKKIKYNSLIQNLIFFIIINFAIYISLFSIFKWNIWDIVIRWVLRNVLSTLSMFYIHKINFFYKTINKLDYYYRIICVVVWMIVNLVLLIKTKIPWELIFFLFLLYLWIQGMILFYVIKFLNNLEFQKEENNLI